MMKKAAKRGVGVMMWATRWVVVLVLLGWGRCEREWGQEWGTARHASTGVSLRCAAGARPQRGAPCARPRDDRGAGWEWGLDAVFAGGASG